MAGRKGHRKHSLVNQKRDLHLFRSQLYEMFSLTLHSDLHLSQIYNVNEKGKHVIVMITGHKSR